MRLNYWQCGILILTEPGTYSKFTLMSKWRISKVMRKTNRSKQCRNISLGLLNATGNLVAFFAFNKYQGCSDTSRKIRYFMRVRQSCAYTVIFIKREDLCFISEASNWC